MGRGFGDSGVVNEIPDPESFKVHFKNLHIL